MTIQDLETALLRAYVKTVILENDCGCGAPPFTDGNPCSVCAGLLLLVSFQDYSPTNLTALAEMAGTDERVLMAVDLDKFWGLLIYLERLNSISLQAMAFFKDDRPIQFPREMEIIRNLQKSGRSNVYILKMLYRAACDE